MTHLSSSSRCGSLWHDGERPWSLLVSAPATGENTLPARWEITICDRKCRSNEKKYHVK